MLKAKSQTLIYGYRRLLQKLDGPNYIHLLKVMAAQVLPTLSYGLVTWLGGEIGLLNTLQNKIYKEVFKLPKCSSPAQVRLEFGLQNQIFRAKSTFVKFCHKLRAADPDTLNNLCWQAINTDPTQPWAIHLEKCLVDFDLQVTWNKKVDQASFCKIVNSIAKRKSVLEDKQTLSHRRHAWSVISSYSLQQPQAYLATHFSHYLKKYLINLRMGLHESKDLLPSWKPQDDCPKCRLCGYHTESLVHLFCVCPSLMVSRRRFIRDILNNLKIRTCRQAVIFWLGGSSPILTCRGLKFMMEIRKQLQASQ